MCKGVGAQPNEVEGTDTDTEVEGSDTEDEFFEEGCINLYEVEGTDTELLVNNVDAKGDGFNVTCAFGTSINVDDEWFCS